MKTSEGRLRDVLHMVTFTQFAGGMRYDASSQSIYRDVNYAIIRQFRWVVYRAVGNDVGYEKAAAANGMRAPMVHDDLRAGHVSTGFPDTVLKEIKDGGGL